MAPSKDLLDQPEAGLHEKLPGYGQEHSDWHTLPLLLSLYITLSSAHFSIVWGLASTQLCNIS
jgi:hypothetical protein